MKKVYRGRIDKDSYVAIKEWCEKKNFTNFKRLYHDAFARNAFWGFKIWRIIRNTVTGRYRKIVYGVRLGEIVVKE
jgi:hypothetical protein